MGETELGVIMVDVDEFLAQKERVEKFVSCGYS